MRTAFEDARRRATNSVEQWQSRILHTPSAIPVTIGSAGLLGAIILLLQPGVRQRLVALWHLRVAPAAEMTPHLATIQYGEMLRLLAGRACARDRRRRLSNSPYLYRIVI